MKTVVGQVSGAAWAVWTSLLLVVAGATPSAQADNVVRWTTNYYTVTGDTLRDVRRSINTSRPWKNRVESDAITTWTVSWNFTTLLTEQGCQVSGVSIATTITTTLPRYAPSTNAPVDLRQRWARYFSALSNHEAQHAAIGTAAGVDVFHRLSGVSGQPNCNSLRREVDTLGRAIVEQRRREERDLDVRTRHGAVDGAHFP